MDTSKKEKLLEKYRQDLNRYVEEYRKAAKFSPDEKITEDMLKYESWRIKNYAIMHGIPSEDLREAILNS